MDAAENNPLSLPTKDTIVEVPVSSGSILQNGEEEYYYFLFNCRKEWGNVHLYCTFTYRLYILVIIYLTPPQKKSEGTSLYVYTWYPLLAKTIQRRAGPGLPCKFKIACPRSYNIFIPALDELVFVCDVTKPSARFWWGKIIQTVGYCIVAHFYLPMLNAGIIAVILKFDISYI